MIRVGIIGLGGIASVHIAAYSRIEGVRLVCAADALGERARGYEAIRGTGVKLYTDAEEMMKNEQLDAVDICAPSFLHKELSLKALELGLNVLCEKPMALNSTDAELMADVAEKADSIFMIAQLIRFAAPYMHLRDTVASGRLGKPVSFSFSRLSATPRWRLEGGAVDGKLNGGVMLDLSIHDVDFIYSLFGEPKDIVGVYHPMTESDQNDYYTAELVYDNVTVRVTGGFYVPDIAFAAEFHAIFEGGEIRLDRFGNLYENGKLLDIKDEEYEGAISGLNISMSECFVREINYFIECVRAKATPEIALPASTAAAISLAERIIKSCKEV